ncbi:hypothetical protein [Allomesorhizobium alhagi]|uniref:Uncharacterized protein n=1 Tax=Mesorhizobium alhagi CCNWXJ12-2 TaxID=1107882 RepID=H0HNJ4_9HYPH|nr:hypothetical protein [Mesorhizobium alhagi]EHK57647.1 hypothetical protein MAXJ12_08584 [Mesorhizobium alhagi CCNWXJ12-2]
MSPSEMAIELEKMARAKATWLDTFSSGRNKRPELEIITKRRELDVLEQAVADYRRQA